MTKKELKLMNKTIRKCAGIVRKAMYPKYVLDADPPVSALSVNVKLASVGMELLRHIKHGRR